MNIREAIKTGMNMIKKKYRRCNIKIKDDNGKCF